MPIRIQPIEILDARCHKRTFYTVEDAARFLTEEWPGAPSAAFKAACKACLATLGGTGAPEAAHAAIIRAAEEAAILCQPPTTRSRTRLGGKSGGRRGGSRSQK